MYYGAVKKFDIANGEGVRTTIFVSGCRNCCKNCFNKETWDFCYGKPYTQNEEDLIIEACKKPYIKGLSVLGGEPFEKANQKVVKAVADIKNGKYPKEGLGTRTFS